MRRTVIKVRAAPALLVLGVILGLMWPQTASAATTQMTATVGLNIRSGPSTNSAILGGLYRGQTVSAISSSQGWTKITFAGSTAYVASRYLTKGKDLPPPSRIGAGTIKVTTTALNLRSGPGLSYRVIKVLKEGTRVTMTGKTARGWAQLVNGKSTGWSSTQYLASSMNGRPAVIGKRVATADLDIRTTSGAGSRTVAEVKKGTALSVTGAIQNGRAQIIYKGAVRWVTARYLKNLASNLPSPPKSAQDHRDAVRHGRAGHPLHLRQQVPIDHRSAAGHQVEHHRRGQERPDADHLRQGRSLGDCQVPRQVCPRRGAVKLASSREGPQAERDQGSSGDAGKISPDHRLWRCAAICDSRP